MNQSLGLRRRIVQAMLRGDVEATYSLLQETWLILEAEQRRELLLELIIDYPEAVETLRKANERRRDSFSWGAIQPTAERAELQRDSTHPINSEKVLQKWYALSLGSLRSRSRVLYFLDTAHANAAHWASQWVQCAPKGACPIQVDRGCFEWEIAERIVALDENAPFELTFLARNGLSDELKAWLRTLRVCLCDLDKTLQRDKLLERIDQALECA